MIKLGVIEGDIEIVKNKSNRFESRFSTVSVKNSSSIFLKDMYDLNFGVWVSNTEGQFKFNKNDIPKLIKSNQIPIQYVDYFNKPTMKYPHNPNHSMLSTAAITSLNGRHLAMMPHPERSFMKWQIPWVSKNTYMPNDYSPWFKIFTNAYEWCDFINRKL